MTAHPVTGQTTSLSMRQLLTEALECHSVLSVRLNGWAGDQGLNEAGQELDMNCRPIVYEASLSKAEAHSGVLTSCTSCNVTL